MNILVTGAGGPAGVAVIEILRQSEHQVIAVDMSAHSAGLFLVPPERRFVVPGGTRMGFIPAIIDICRNENVDLIIPTVDAELIPLATNENIFRAMGVQLALSPLETLRTALDKWKLADALRGKTPLPRTEVLDEKFSASDWVYPVVVKPRVGSGSRGVRIIHRAEDMDGIRRDGKCIVQSYLPGEEFSVDLFGTDTDVVGSARRRVKMNGGVAVISQTVDIPELVEDAVAIYRHIGLKYAVNIQFRMDEKGMPRLLEINPRFPGGTSLTQRAGLKWVDATVQIAQGLRPTLNRDLEECVMVRRYEEQYLSPENFESVKHVFGPLGLDYFASECWD